MLPGRIAAADRGHGFEPIVVRGPHARGDPHRGAGYGGALLAWSLASAAPQGLPGPFQALQFGFASRVSLTPESVYTFQLVKLSGPGTSLSLGAIFNDTYTRVDAYSAGGSTFPSSVGLDLAFNEGIDTARNPVPVPEPHPLAGAGLGIGLAAGVALKRRRRASGGRARSI